MRLTKIWHEEGKHILKELAANDDGDCRVICFDLQQTLPVPRISTNIAYYKRKLWMYNLYIHDLKANKSKFYVWDEVNGGQGSVEIVACLNRWIEEEYAKAPFHKLKVVTDNSGGQNKNINVILYYLKQIHDGKFKIIEHLFLVPGHSYMPCDRAFGNIEKCVRGFQDARRFVLKDNFSEGYLVGMDYNTPLGSVRLMKGTVHLAPKYPHPIQLRKGKVKHLKDLLSFILEQYRGYLQHVITEQEHAPENAEPHQEESSDEEDVDNTLMDYDS
ncbi:hypothetical protein E2C01_062143 [Portunus trituberculatus]|uniref:DUF7869 domain-containing protein n=1 Tax=Portunus trituberculatus TaxID=210409 RepID=A0A5B7HD92_PORTR|nr:hypothetical protein [Portunus trituberculatus]